MASWSEIESDAPDLAARARGLFDAHVHKTLATLRRDGSPRISGIEIEFKDGELWFGSMWLGVKALDLRRDPRYALHSGSADPSADWEGDAKVAGRAEEITDPERAKPGSSHLFRADVDELVIVAVGTPRDHLLIETWHPGRGYESRKRY
jgi:hypothetical protein